MIGNTNKETEITTSYICRYSPGKFGPTPSLPPLFQAEESTFQHLSLQ